MSSHRPSDRHAAWRAVRAAVLGPGLVVALLAATAPIGTSGASAAPTASPTPATTAPAEPRVAPDRPLVGAFVERGPYATTAEAAAAVEETLGRRLDVQRVFLRWDDPLDGPAVADAVARGRIPMVSVLPQHLDGSRLTWAQIASGEVDEQIRAHAAQAAALGPVVYLTLHHEADIASPSYGTAAQYVAAWRHWVGLMRDEGVTNALWTWITSPVAVSRPSSDPGGGGFYPGDDVVDRIGADVYNWAACRTNVPAEWRSLATATEGLRQFAAVHGKHAVLPEWGSVEDPADPERRARWLREAFAHLTSWPQLEAAVYFDTVGTCDWRLGTSPAATAAFREAAQGVRARPSAWLSGPRAAVPSTSPVTFDLAASTGTGAAPGTGVAAWTLDHGDGTSSSGVGHPAEPVLHGYAPGTWTATLTVTDATGATAVDRATVRVASAPRVLGTLTHGLTSTSVGLRAWVDTAGLPGGARFTWRTESGTVGSFLVPLAPRHGSQQLDAAVEGLRPGTRYTWEVTAVTETATTREGWFHTPGPPTVRPLPATSVTRTSARVELRVHPNGVGTVAWVEHGTSLPGTRSPVLDLGAVTYERAAQVVLTGLSPGTTYRFRVVAHSSLGHVQGPEQTFTTRP